MTENFLMLTTTANHRFSKVRKHHTGQIQKDYTQAYSNCRELIIEKNLERRQRGKNSFTETKI